MTSQLLNGFKLAAWSGEYKTLKSRYNTYYGKECCVVVYGCHDCRQTEADLKEVLYPFHITNEIYRLEGLPKYHKFCQEVCKPFVVMDNLEEIRFRQALYKKRRQDNIDRAEAHAEQQLLTLQDALPELTASIACCEVPDKEVARSVHQVRLALAGRQHHMKTNANKKRKMMADMKQKQTAKLPEVMAAHTQEILSAMGFEHPFDTATAISQADMLGSAERLQQTKMFSNYKENIKLYSRGAKPEVNWTSSESMKVTANPVLKKSGIQIMAKEAKCKGQRSTHTTSTLTWNLLRRA